MKKTLLFLPVLAIFACTPQQERLAYPETRTDSVTDNYHGTAVADPYRWLEDDNSEETKVWVEAQNKVTFDYLGTIPYRDSIKSRLTKMWDYEKFGAPWKKGGKYYYYYNTGLQNQSVLFSMDELGGTPVEVLNPNTLSADGTVALGSVSISNDAKYLAYSVARGGSDWNEIYVKDLATGELLKDHVEWVKFSGISWKGNGFYYSSYDKPKDGDALKAANEYHKVYYHKLGTEQSADELIYKSNEFPLRNYYAGVSEDEKVLFVFESESTSGTQVYVKKLDDPKAKFVQIAFGFDYEYDMIDHVEGKVLVRTNNGASKYRLVAIDLAKPAAENWMVIIPEKDNLLEWVALAGKKIVAHYMQDVKSKVEIYDLTGKYEKDLEVPGIGTVSGFSSKKDDNEAFYSFTSFTDPGVIFKIDMESGVSEVYKKPEIDFDFDAYETKQVFYTSKDGTKVPMFIVHKKGLKLNGKNPTLLYAYGGFNVSLPPSFSVSRLAFLEQGGVYAQANLRGGGEYGEKWYKAGTVLQKQNVFDDFIAAAEYLIAEKYTSSKKLAIQGGSNGGLLIGAVTNQRPELFAVALPQVGVMDMLRFHKFTIGSIKPNVEYPAVMVTTADHDDRVVPAHSFKYISALQATYKGTNPTIIRIDVKAGHGAGKPTSMRIAEAADTYAFIWKNMGITPEY